MITSIIAAIISICKAIPVVNGWVSLLTEAYVSSQITELNAQQIQVDQKRSVILGNINKATSHEEKRVLFSVLNDLDRLPARSNVPDTVG